jgi:molybdopterin-binding protein
MRARLGVETDGGATLGTARIRLLGAVDRLGSISKAARGDTSARTSVSNHLTKVVSRIQEGAVNAEVVLDLPLTRTRHVTSIITMQAVASLALSVGSPATAAFQATSVILAAFN